MANMQFMFMTTLVFFLVLSTTTTTITIHARQIQSDDPELTHFFKTQQSKAQVFPSNDNHDGDAKGFSQPNFYQQTKEYNPLGFSGQQPPPPPPHTTTTPTTVQERYQNANYKPEAETKEEEEVTEQEQYRNNNYAYKPQDNNKDVAKEEEEYDTHNNYRTNQYRNNNYAFKPQDNNKDVAKEEEVDTYNNYRTNQYRNNNYAYNSKFEAAANYETDRLLSPPPPPPPPPSPVTDNIFEDDKALNKYLDANRQTSYNRARQSYNTKFQAEEEEDEKPTTTTTKKSYYTEDELDALFNNSPEAKYDEEFDLEEDDDNVQGKGMSDTKQTEYSFNAKTGTYNNAQKLYNQQRGNPFSGAYYHKNEAGEFTQVPRTNNPYQYNNDP